MLAAVPALFWPAWLMKRALSAPRSIRLWFLLLCSLHRPPAHGLNLFCERAGPCCQWIPPQPPLLPIRKKRRSSLRLKIISVETLGARPVLFEAVHSSSRSFHTGTKPSQTLSPPI